MDRHISFVFELNLKFCPKPQKAYICIDALSVRFSHFVVLTKYFTMIYISKRLPLLVLVFLLFSGFNASGQNTVNDVKDKAIDAITKGDAKVFTSYFNNPIDINLPYNDDSYSKTQAAVIVQKFLLQYKVESFDVKQTGNSTDGSVFVIGIYKAKNGQVFRVYLLIKMQASSAFIHLLEFEEE